MSGWGNPADLPGYNAPGEEWYASSLSPSQTVQPKAPKPGPPVGSVVAFFVGIVLISAVFAIF